MFTEVRKALIGTFSTVESNLFEKDQSSRNIECKFKNSENLKKETEILCQKKPELENCIQYNKSAFLKKKKTTTGCA